MLKDENKESLRELLHLPHFHQYEKNYVDMLDHGKKLKLDLKSRKNIKSETNTNEENNEQENFEFEETNDNECKESVKSTDEDESVSIDLESVDDFNPTSKVNFNIINFKYKIKKSLIV